MSENAFRLIAPPVAPFHHDGELNLAPVEQQAELLVRTGVDGVFANGTTGECASLTLAERTDLLARWVDVVQGKLEVIAQIGDNCQAHAIHLAAHAQQCGADATACFAPSYFRPDDVESLIEFLRPVAAAAGDLPFYFYDIPSTTNVRLPMAELLDKAKPRIPNLVGLKYSNSDLVQLQECLQVDDRGYQVLFGCDEILLAGVALGVHGAIGSTYNFAAPLYRRMMAAFAAGDGELARACQLKSMQVIQRMKQVSFLAACKHAMGLFGIECGPVRPPLRNLTESERERLFEDLERLGIRELAHHSPAKLPKRSAESAGTR